jgi:hypothetical protein
MPDPFPRSLGRELEELARAMRGALAGLRAAAETLARYPDLASASRDRLLAVVAQESERLGELVRGLERTASSTGPAAGGEATESVTVDELMAHLASAAAELGFEVELRREATLPPPRTRLGVAGPPAVAALAALLAALRREMAVSRLELRARLADRHLLLDLGWSPDPGDLPRLLDWQGEALDAPGTGERSAARALRPLVREHDGEAWFNLDRDGGAAHVKVLLPLAAEVETSTA